MFSLYLQLVVVNANQKAANATWIESVAARNVLQRMWHLHIARETYSANVDKKIKNNFVENSYEILNAINSTLANIKINRISFHFINICERLLII